MRAYAPFQKRDWLTAAAFFTSALLLYTPFRTRLAYLWDSVEFVLAIRHYDVALSQPHAPGYFLYIMLGRLVNQLVGDPHASLIWMSLVSAAGLVGLMYLLGTAMFGRKVGLGAALVTLTSPMVWFYSDVALTYTVDAFLVTLFVLVCWRARQSGVGWPYAIGMGILLAVIGGVRQQSVLGMGVVFVLTLWTATAQRGSKILVSVGLWLLLSALWSGTMLHMVGGWEAYWQPLQKIGRFHAHKTLMGGGLDALSWNLFFAILYSCDGLLLGAVILSGGILWYTIGLSKDRQQTLKSYDGSAWRVIAAWIMPVFILATFVGYSEAHGHVFTYLPGFFLLTGYIFAQMTRKYLPVCLLSIVCLVNIATFIAWPASWEGFMWGTMRTARELRTHDERLEAAVQTIRSNFRPEETVVCHVQGDLFFGLRHFQLYLPEYEQLRLDPDEAMVYPVGRPIMVTHGTETEFIGTSQIERFRTAILVVPKGSRLDGFRPYVDTAKAQPVCEGGLGIYRVDTAVH